MCGCSRDTHRLRVERGRGRNDDATAAVLYFARFDGGGEIVGVWMRRLQGELAVAPLFVGFPSLFVAPSGEQLALLMRLSGTSLSTISRVFSLIFFSGQSVVVHVEGVGFRPRADVVGREVMSGCTRIYSQ